MESSEKFVEIQSIWNEKVIYLRKLPVYQKKSFLQTAIDSFCKITSWFEQKLFSFWYY